MNEENLDDFVHRVMDITATTPGMGSASTGILGMSAFGDGTVYDLKTKTVKFATLYRDIKSDPDTSTLISAEKEIEGLLQGLVTVSVISEQDCGLLTTKLQNIMSAIGTPKE
jgi:hypothetical protein